MLADHLTDENVDELIAAATHQSKSQIAVMLAHRYPKPDAPTRIVPILTPVATLTLENPNETDVIGKVSPAPVRVTLAESQPGLVPVSDPVSVPVQIPTPLSPPRITPTSPERYKFQFTLTQNTYELLQQAQDLLGHQVATRNVDEVFRRALELLVAKLEKQKFATTENPRVAKPKPSRNARNIPADVRRAIRTRDGGRCTFTSSSGHRCESKRVAFDHIVPIAKGGHSTVSNLRLRCRAHNQFAAEREFGTEFMKAKRKQYQRKADELRARARSRAALALAEVAAMVDRASAAQAAISESQPATG